MLTAKEQARFDHLARKINLRQGATRAELRRYLDLQVKRRTDDGSRRTSPASQGG